MSPKRRLNPVFFNAMTAFNCATISSQPTFPGRKRGKGEGREVRRGKKQISLQNLLYAKKFQ